MDFNDSVNHSPKMINRNDISTPPNEILTNLVNLEAVVALERILTCSVCDAAFATKDELFSHTLSHDQVFKYFDLAMGLMMYKATVQLERVDIFECMKCSRGFTDKTDYELHKLTHLKKLLNGDQDKRYKCNYCQLYFVEDENLQRHLYTHRPIPFICFCGLGYQHTADIQEHLELVHEVAFEEPTGLTNSVFDSLVCEWQTYYCENTKDPIQTRGIKSWYEQTKEDKVRCQNCNKTDHSNGFSQMRIDLENRLKGLMDTNKCEDCGSQFVQTPSLKVYKCYLCPKAFLGYQSVENHENTEHKKQQSSANLSSVLGQISEHMEQLF